MSDHAGFLLCKSEGRHVIDCPLYYMAPFFFKKKKESDIQTNTPLDASGAKTHLGMHGEQEIDPQRF